MWFNPRFNGAKNKNKNGSNSFPGVTLVVDYGK